MDEINQFKRNTFFESFQVKRKCLGRHGSWADKLNQKKNTFLKVQVFKLKELSVCH